MRHVWSTHSRTIGISLALVVLTLFGLAAPASAGAQVPFNATITAVVNSSTRLPGGLTQYDEGLAGNATYLGNYTGTATRLQNQQGNFSVTGCMVAANGTDSVCFAVSGGHYDSTPDPCVAIATGPYTVTGGTGKFANATGSGTYTAQLDQCAGTVSVTFTGMISQPNSG